jgi:Glycosyl transferase family 90
MRPEPFKDLTRPYWVRRRLARHVPRGYTVRLCAPTAPRQWATVELRRQGKSVCLDLAKRKDIADDRVFQHYRDHLPVVVHVFSRALADRVVAEIHDGDRWEAPGHVLFSNNQPDAILIPDPVFFNSDAYARHRAQLAGQRPWAERSDVIIWRGATTGVGLAPRACGDLTSPAVLPRVRLCALLAGIEAVDARIYWVVQSDHPADDEAALVRAGLLGPRVDAEAWLDNKFALDIDGNTNAWSNLFTRLLFGCCVLKVASPHGYRQWYYDRLAPWETFVPVDADLGNLLERIDWCRAHPAECARIAAAGQALALSMTVRGETEFAVAQLNQSLGVAA